MTHYRYRAISTNGSVTTGLLEAPSRPAALERLRGQGLVPIEAEAATVPGDVKRKSVDAASRKAVTRAMAELAVLLQSGLTLDRALGLATESLSHKQVAAAFRSLHGEVKQGQPLSRAMASQGKLFTPMACAMVEAGEANGRLGDALADLAATLEREEELRALISSSLTYPVILAFVATGVILVMLLFVVPQFETLFDSAKAQLPPASRMLMAASHALRDYGLYMLAGIIVLVALIAQWLKQDKMRLTVDRWLLGLPSIGTLIQSAQTARFARVMGSLVEAGVALPSALAIAQRSISNRHMADALVQVGRSLKEGGGLTGPIVAAGILPKMAIGFLRTGEETSQLGPMLTRLATVLERDVRLRLQHLMAILTPAITLALGGVVAFVIASILSAILGFNDLALAQ